MSSPSLPALHDLHPRKLTPPDGADGVDDVDDVDASSLAQRAGEWWNPWRLVFRETVERDASQTAQHVVRITAKEGVVSRQKEMRDALHAKFAPMFDERQGWRAGKNAGKLMVTCSDHSKNTIEWEYALPLNDSYLPPDGIPSVSRLPHADTGAFLRAALGGAPVALVESLYTWRPAPGLAPSISRAEWLLERQGDVGEQDMGWKQRLRRATWGAAAGAPAGAPADASDSTREMWRVGVQPSNK